MRIPKEGIRLHGVNVNAITQQRQPLLAFGDAYPKILKRDKKQCSLSQHPLSLMCMGQHDQPDIVAFTELALQAKMNLGKCRLILR